MNLYIKYFSMHLKSQMQYKFSFYMTALGWFLSSFTALLGIWFMFYRFNKVEGFSFPQVLLCSAVVLMAFAIAECFGRSFDIFSRMIGNGEFDRVLVRPRNEIFQVLASQMEFTRLGRLLQAILVLCYAIPASGVVWTWNRILTLFLMIFCGSIVFFSLFMINAALTFFTIEGLEIMNIFTDGSREFGRYPLSVYGKEALWFYTFIIPLALVQYYPLLYLLGREKSVFYMLTPLFGLLFLFPSYILWRFGLSKYKSTGS